MEHLLTSTIMRDLTALCCALQGDSWHQVSLSHPGNQLTYPTGS